MSPEEVAALAKELSEVLTADLTAKAKERGLPPLGFTLVVTEFGQGHAGYASTIDRPGSIALLRSVLRNLSPFRS